MGQLEIKPGPLCYLAGPITFDPEGSKLWRKRAEACLVEEGVAVFNPREAFSVPENRWSDPDFLSPIQVINDIAIMMSRVAIVHVAYDLRSAGTEHEMRLCAELGIPVILWVPWLEPGEAYQAGHCHYIDDVEAEYSQDFKCVAVVRTIPAAASVAHRHALAEING